MNVTGGTDMTLHEISEASSLIHKETHDDANIIFGAVVDENMGDQFRVTVIATGLGELEKRKERTTRLQVVPGDQEEDLDVPTFLRRGRALDDFSGFRFSKTDASQAAESERYDVPTFMRKQAD